MAPLPVRFALGLACALVLASTSALAANPALSLPPPPHVARSTTHDTAVPRDSVTTAPTSWSPDEKSVYLAALLGFSTNDLNLGLGVRGGKMITDHLSIGGTFVYQLGRSVDSSVPTGVPTGTAGVPAVASYSASFSMFYLGPEVAYDFPIAPVIVRPYAGIGVAQLSTSVSGGGLSAGTSDTKLVLWPGCQVIYDVPDTGYFIAGDARLVTVPGGPALGAFFGAGMKI